MFTFKKTNYSKCVEVVHYPDRILIATRNLFKEGGSYITNYLSEIQIDTSHYELGKLVIEHIDKSRIKNIPSDEIKMFRMAYLKLNKFKSELASMKNARYMLIDYDNTTYRIRPMLNAYSDKLRAAYYGLPDEIVELNNQTDYEKLGRTIIELWDKCQFK